MLRRAASLVLVTAALASCGNTFEPASSINSLRVIGVQVDPPYGKPGGKETLKILYHDGSKRAFDAQGNRKRTPQVLWLGGCHDPPGDLYYACFPILAQIFAALAPPGSGGAGGAGVPGGLPGGLPGGANPLDYAGFGDTFRFTVPEDIISRRPAQEVEAIKAQGNQPYGLSYTFFAVCGGTIKPIPIDQASNGLPIGCFDNETNERLGDDDFVIGYTPTYSYDSITNKNPVIDGVTFEGQPGMTTACSASQPCAGNTRCGSQGVCLPVVPHCTERKVADCPTYKVKPVLSALPNVEKDAAAQPIDGRVPDEVIWTSFYASDGTLTNDTVLVNDALRGWVFDANEGAKWSAPNAQAGESRLWVVVRDNRGGTTWTWQDVFVD